MMEICPKAPGLFAILRGARGTLWRIGVTAALYTFLFLAILTAAQLLSHH